MGICTQNVFLSAVKHAESLKALCKFPIIIMWFYYFNFKYNKLSKGKSKIKKY